MIERFEMNPVIRKEQVKPSQEGYEVIGAFNAGAVMHNGEVLLLARIAEKPNGTSARIVPCITYDSNRKENVLREFTKGDEGIDTSDLRIIKTSSQNYLTSISHFRLARSHDGFNFIIDEESTITAGNEYESFGIEDPRITKLNDKYYITYSSASECGIVTGLISTRDFSTFEREGIIFPPDNKDVVIFPEKVNNKYYALHRPSSSYFGKLDLWIAESTNLREWGNHKRIASIRPGMWDSERIGAGPVPILTEQGWLIIYHGANEKNRYCLGVMLLDKEQPWKVLARSDQPLFSPEVPYELDGFFGNVVFSCGAVQIKDRIIVYYGAADENTACFSMELSDAFTNIEGTYRHDK